MSKLRLEEILRQKDQLSRRQRVLCKYIIENANEADMLTAKQLAAAAGVGDATVFRFLKEYGYASYAEFRAELHKYVVEFTRSSYWQMKASLQSETGPKKGHVLYQAFSSSIDLIEKSMTSKLAGQFDDAVDAMLSASEVGLLGLRSSKAVALYFHAILMPFFPKTKQFSYDEHFIFEQIKSMSEGSVLFVISSWPNTKMTVQAAEYCHNLGHKIILLTNSFLCPITAYADLLLIVPEARERYTIVPYISILEALAREIGKRLAPESIYKLEEMDEILALQQVTNWEDRKKALSPEKF